MFASFQSNGNDYLQFYSELIVGTYKRIIKVKYEKHLSTLGVYHVFQV